MFVGGTPLFVWLKNEHKLTVSQAYLIAEIAYTSMGSLLWSDTRSRISTYRVCARKGWLGGDRLGIGIALTEKAKTLIAAYQPRLAEWTIRRQHGA